MFSSISSDANDPQGVDASLSTKQTNKQSLPDDIKSIKNKFSYKAAVKRHLLTAGQSREAGIYNYF